MIRNTLSVVVLLFAMTMTACQSTGYGGGVEVSINVETPDAVPASEGKALAVRGWVLNVKHWAAIEGKDRFAKLSKLDRDRSTDEQAAESYSELRTELMDAMDEDRITTFRSREATRELPKDTLWFVVDYDGKLTCDKFDVATQRSVTIKV